MSYGYPDFSRTQAEAGSQLGSYFGQKQTDPQTGIMYAIGYAFLTIQVNDFSNLNHFTVVITWYDDNAGTNIVNTSSFVPVPGSRLSYQIPCVSKYARVLIQHQVAFDTEVIGGIVYGSNVQTVGAIIGPQAGPMISISQSLASGANASQPAQFTAWGGAILYGNTSSGTNYAVQVNYFDMNSASFKTLVSFGGATHGSDLCFQIALPPNPVEVTIINGDAVARTVTATLALL